MGDPPDQPCDAGRVCSEGKPEFDLELAGVLFGGFFQRGLTPLRASGRATSTPSLHSSSDRSGEYLPKSARGNPLSGIYASGAITPCTYRGS